MPPTPELSALTGVRSGKRSYYRAYVASDERMARAVRAMDSISRALVRTVEGPRALLEEVVRAAAEHLDPDWTLLGLADGHLPLARPRFVAAGPDGIATDEQVVPTDVRRELSAVRVGVAAGASGWTRVPMTLEGRQVGSLVVRHGVGAAPEPADLSVLRILANQAAVSLHTSEQYQSGVALHRRAQRLYDDATAQAEDLARRTAELRATEHRLRAAHQRELLDAERHRIARELHDSVSQYVLSVGMTLEVARSDLLGLGGRAGEVAQLLADAKEMTGRAVEQLRRSIYALHRDEGHGVAALPDLLEGMAAQHRPHLRVDVRVEGVRRPLGGEVEHDLARIAGEALFNVAVHAGATRSVVRLRYRRDELLLSIADDGSGDPTQLRRTLQVAQRADADGRHRGLVNMDSRITGLGGTLSFRRARMGGVRLEARMPMPVEDQQEDA